jgi:hypothetical protein
MKRRGGSGGTFGGGTTSCGLTALALLSLPVGFVGGLALWLFG